MEESAYTIADYFVVFGEGMSFGIMMCWLSYYGVGMVGRGVIALARGFGSSR